MNTVVYPATEIALMQRVKSVCGSWIDEAVQGTPYPAALLGALAANESGGDPTKSRPEANVLLQLAQVLIGTRSHFGSITTGDLELVFQHPPAGSPLRNYQVGMLQLVNAATSWGPTQIVGYQAVAGGYELSELTSLNTHFKHVVEMLVAFEKQFRLFEVNLATLPEYAEWEPFFRCWNTGSPTGKTFDPMYAQNGLLRMAIYETL